MSALRAILIGGLIILVIAVLLVWGAVRYQIRPYESGPRAEVSWVEGGTPGIVRVAVRDATGETAPGVSVHVLNESGGNVATTDESGISSHQMGEAEFTGLSIDGVWVVKRPHAYMLGEPNVNAGLLIEVRKK